MNEIKVELNKIFIVQNSDVMIKEMESDENE